MNSPIMRRPTTQHWKIIHIIIIIRYSFLQVSITISYNTNNLIYKMRRDISDLKDFQRQFDIVNMSPCLGRNYRCGVLSGGKTGFFNAPNVHKSGIMDVQISKGPFQEL